MDKLSVSVQVYEDLTQADHKAEDLAYAQRRSFWISDSRKIFFISILITNLKRVAIFLIIIIDCILYPIHGCGRFESPIPYTGGQLGRHPCEIDMYPHRLNCL